MKDKSSSLTKNKVFSVLRFLLLIILCVSASVILVWPLWKFSISFPKVYTIITLSLIGVTLLYLCINKIRKSSLSSVIKFIGNLLITSAGIFFSVKLVLNEKKLIALAVFLLTIIFIAVFNYILNRIRHE